MGTARSVKSGGENPPCISALPAGALLEWAGFTNNVAISLLKKGGMMLKGKIFLGSLVVLLTMLVVSGCFCGKDPVNLKESKASLREKVAEKQVAKEAARAISAEIEKADIKEATRGF